MRPEAGALTSPQWKRPRSIALRGRSRRVRVATVLASDAAVLILAAVGRGGDDAGDAGEPPEDRRAGATRVELREFGIDPARLELKRGATLDVRNSGAIAQNLTIERRQDATQPSERLAGTSTFGGRESERLRVDLPPGRYALVCTVGDHRGAGWSAR